MYDNAKISMQWKTIQNNSKQYKLFLTYKEKLCRGDSQAYQTRNISNQSISFPGSTIFGNRSFHDIHVPFPSVPVLEPNYCQR